MDHATWSAARLTENSNPSQGIANAVYESNLLCGGTSPVLPAPDPAADFRVCGGQFSESLEDGGQYVTKESYIRQPFDFAGRMGSVTFDVDAKTDGSHTWWPELWLTDLPIPAPNDGPGILSHPNKGIQFKFDAECSTNEGALGELFFYDNYVQSGVPSTATATVLNGGCYATQPGVLNHFQVKISASEIQVWASDPGGGNFRELNDITGLSLDFTRGYVHIEHTQYAGLKFDTQPQATDDQTYTWDNIGFDGPVLPIDRAYDVPDPTTLGRCGIPCDNLGYGVFSSGGLTMENADTTRTVYPVSLSNVKVSDAVAAFITVNSWGGACPTTISYQFNGGQWVDYASPFCPGSASVAIAIPVDLTKVVDGTDTLNFKSSSEVVLSNIGLKVVPSGASPTPSSTPKPSPTPSPTGIPSPTPSATPCFPPHNKNRCP